MKKNIYSKFRSFQVRVTLILVLSMVLIGAMSNFLIYKFALNAQFAQLRDKLQMVAQTAALMVDGDVLKQIPLNRDGVNSLSYQAITAQLQRIKRTNPPIRFIYAMGKTSKNGVLAFIVDPDPSGVGRAKGLTAYPGDTYNAARFPELMHSFEGPTADKKLSVDEWGAALSGYAPIRDSSGKTVAILGVDITAADVYATQQGVRKRFILVLGLGFMLSVAFGILLSRRITNPIKKLLEGTRHISMGDLRYHVEVENDDEISELARSFNDMTSSLYDSRRRIHNYFYSVIQSFARIVEARDHYTRGHSERVAEFAQKIAQKMGFSADEVELLKETAILHDIGKLGVQENILNKKEQLTEEEWEVIRKHPVVGEDILRPVLVEKEMLAIVRQHHERFDGKGYPNRLKGDEINIFAQILSVADAFDAMTSSRAYRAALTKDEAIKELKANSGTQFNPKVTEAFLEILAQEK